MKNEERKKKRKKKMWQECVVFWQERHEWKCQIIPADLQCYVCFFLRKPHCSEANKPLDCKTHINRLFTILSIVLYEQLVKAMGL